MARMRVQRRFGEAEAGKQAAVARERQAHPEVDARQAKPSCLHLRGMHQLRGEALIAATGRDGEAAEIKAAVLFRP